MNLSMSSCARGSRARDAVAFAMLVLLSVALGAQAEGPFPGPFESSAVGDTYDIRVHLPASYDSEPDRTYPLVVTLDANYWFDESSSLSNGFKTAPGGLCEIADALVEAGLVPEMILVGVGYPEEMMRARDYHGSPSLFFAFLRSELLPALVEQYRVDDASTVLFGHSSAATFAVYAFLTAAIYDVGFFRHVAAVSGDYTRTENAVPELESTLARRVDAGRVSPAGSLYLGYGAQEEVRFQLPARELYGQLQSREYGQVRLRLTEFVGRDHGTVVSPAFREALRWILGDLSIGADE